MIQIKEMVIRVPGLGEEEARLLAGEVAERISVGMPQAATNRYIDALGVQLSLPEDLSIGEAADLISEQLLRQLNVT